MGRTKWSPGSTASGAGKEAAKYSLRVDLTAKSTWQDGKTGLYSMGCLCSQKMIQLAAANWRYCWLKGISWRGLQCLDLGASPLVSSIAMLRRMLLYACVELDPEKVAKTKWWIFLEVKYNFRWSLMAKNRHVQFGNFTIQGKSFNSKCTLMASP